MILPRLIELTVKIILPGERPLSWNEFYSGIHWKKRQLKAGMAHLVVREAIDPSQTFGFTFPVDITVTVYFSKRPLDADNITSKLYIDGLVRAGVLPDDNPDYVGSVMTVTRVDRVNPRVEIDIE